MEDMTWGATVLILRKVTCRAIVKKLLSPRIKKYSHACARGVVDRMRQAAEPNSTQTQQMKQKAARWHRAAFS